MEQETNQKESCLSIIGLLFIFFILIPIVDGFVVSKCWKWFVIPIFSLPALPLIYALGITGTMRFINQGLNSLDCFLHKYLSFLDYLPWWPGALRRAFCYKANGEEVPWDNIIDVWVRKKYN